MGENYLVQIDKGEEVPVRLVGLIDEKECEAVLNTEDAARKVSTAEGISTHDAPSPFGKRFVLVIRVASVAFGKDVPIIFISPIINQVSYIQGNREFRCNEGEKAHYYRFVALVNETKD